ncbi:helix-turn-helix domain-containing protein [Tissierella carlieri]|uniref:helix-turn-helix domain-containing protein n=1 Tax=Tissierella carlieri TaxID=689904 RepID=UPI0023ED135C|nr:helix-turn-helix transcriptional regulator [Tissierella carlieri]MBU5311049.1 helix-turn-helix domain-containing protein [Tissierella carlieri]
MLRGSQLKRMRILKNITQEEVADALDVKRNYISMLENETRAIPQDKYEKWLEYLNSKEARAIRDKRLEKKVKK